MGRSSSQQSLILLHFQFPSSRVIQIQGEMTERALELLNLPDRPCLLLDIGCGSGLSGEQITEAGHYWTGLDISLDMLSMNTTPFLTFQAPPVNPPFRIGAILPLLDVAQERDLEGDLVLGDIGQGLPFRPASFDGAISISVIQWLCNADKTVNKPYQRLAKVTSFFLGF